jgi:adenine-specific DNA-methyltransferase
MAKKYSDISCLLTNMIDKKEKKDNGIYFTNPNTVCKALEYIDAYGITFRNILEPSCGSCEFVNELLDKYPASRITAIEYNKTIYEKIKGISDLADHNDNLKIINEDFLKYNGSAAGTSGYDLIIGNPPYYVMKKTDVAPSLYKYFDGRPNIFILFILKSLELLRENGILCFILPRSFLNCLYYDKTRRHISRTCTIMDIVECEDNFIETEQKTIMLIIKKCSETGAGAGAGAGASSEYIFNINEYMIFGSKSEIVKLRELYNGSRKLSELGFTVSVGSIVWNQHKDILTNDPTKTLLIYSSDIKNNTLNIKKYKDDNKKNYIDRPGITTPLLVINRGYGVGKYKFEYCLINCDENVGEYLVENHLICVKSINNGDGYASDASDAERHAVIEKYKMIIKSFEDSRTAEFIQTYFGNNAINTTELNHIIPIYC